MSSVSAGAFVAFVVAVCATVAAGLDALSGEALAGIYGAIVGGGAGVAVSKFDIDKRV